MASERDEVERELERRRKLRQKRQEERVRQEKQRRALMIRLGAVGVVLLVVTVLIVAFSMGAGERPPVAPTETQNHTSNDQIQGTTSGKEPEQTTPAATEPGEFTTIHIAAAGDLNVTDQMVLNSQTNMGYDFTAAFVDVAPALSQADLTILNYEGTFGGKTLGSETGSAPTQLAQALANLGVDAVQTANSASIRSGILGLQSTIQTLKNAGIEPVGTFTDAAEFRSSGGYTILEVKGLRIALVAFTKGMDNLGLPEGSEDCVNVLYTDYTSDYSEIDRDGIKKVLRRVAEEQPDLTIAMLHWGSEYNEEISASQKSIKRFMLENGVDVILGSHSHLLKAIEHDTEENTLVAYSLGDFYGDTPQPGSNYSIILDIQVTRDNVTGETTIDGFTYTPIYIVQPDQSASGGQRVVRIHEAMARYEGNYLGKVTPGIYSSMEYVLTRIEQRIAEDVD
jgi:poly-gamma-glutamate synthesis protein (capsule biosynthesis protein)